MGLGPRLAGFRRARPWSETRRRTLSVGGRAIIALIEAQGINDLHRIYETAQRDGVHPDLAFIGTDFVAEPHARFDTAYMKRLFDYAYQAGMRGYPWHQGVPSDP